MMQPKKMTENPLRKDAEIDPDKGMMSPADFIPVLEEAELIYKLDLFILEQVLEKMQKLLHQIAIMKMQ